MKTFIYEIGVIDTQDVKHTVQFKNGLNVVTGKSSTGKSALIEIFDYCFGGSDNTIPEGVITEHASMYFVALSVMEKNLVIGRNPNYPAKGFLRSIDSHSTEAVDHKFFEINYFIPLNDFKKNLRGYFLDIDDVDVSLEAKANRPNNRKAPTPSIRSFSSFVLQHQNLIANKHALFYRFDEKEKRDQVIEHTKIFLGLVDQRFFHLSQELERKSSELKKLEREKDTIERASESYKLKVEPVLRQLYAAMGFEEDPLTLSTVLSNPQNAQDLLEREIVPEKINYTSGATSELYNELKLKRDERISHLRSLQRKKVSIQKHINEEEKLVSSVSRIESPKRVQISASVCPFCSTEQDTLEQNAIRLQDAIEKLSKSIPHNRPFRAQFETSLLKATRNVEATRQEINELNKQITQIEQDEQRLVEQRSLYESILMHKARLFAILDTINMSNDDGIEKGIEDLKREMAKIQSELKRYNVRKGLSEAASKVNKYMKEIGKHFEFEASYQPINLHFSFETFDLFHLRKDGKRIYLRTMGSGANWLYSHLTLFLALHKYFAELGEKCAIPSTLFLDQPTQVYFPNFNRDQSESFDDQKKEETKQRSQLKGSNSVDEDIQAVENLFSQLSIYCNDLTDQIGFSPQIIVSDHADDLKLSNGVLFESLVNGNRWRTRGFINPVPDSAIDD